MSNTESSEAISRRKQWEEEHPRQYERDKAQAAEYLAIAKEFSKFLDTWKLPAHPSEHTPALLTLAGQATVLDPNNADAWGFLGYVYAFAGNREGAIQLYQRAIELDPQEEKYRMNLAILEKQKATEQNAESVQQPQLPTDPDLAAIFSKKAHEIFAKYHDFDATVGLLERAAILDPGNAEYKISLAEAYLDLADTDNEETYAMFIKLIQTNARQAAGLTCDKSLTQLSPAEKAHNFALNIAANSLYGIMCCRLGQYEESLGSLDFVLSPGIGENMNDKFKSEILSEVKAAREQAREFCDEKAAAVAKEAKSAGTPSVPVP